MTSTQQRNRRDVALTIVTAAVGLAAIAFAVVAAVLMFSL